MHEASENAGPRGAGWRDWRMASGAWCSSLVARRPSLVARRSTETCRCRQLRVLNAEARTRTCLWLAGCIGSATGGRLQQPH